MLLLISLLQFISCGPVNKMVIPSPFSCSILKINMFVPGSLPGFLKIPGLIPKRKCCMRIHIM